MAKFIELKNVGLFYNRKKSFLKNRNSQKFWALKDVSFHVNKGDVFGIIGKNGAGKSTLMSLLAGITNPDIGSLDIETEAISLLSLQAGFIPYISGRKNILLNGMLLGMEKAEISEHLAEIIDFSELGEFIDQPVGTYSSGMVARLGFSTAIFLNTEVILIDEVLGVGDASFRKKSEKILKEKMRQENITAIIVSHSEKTISDLCNSAVLIDKGKSIFFGATKDCLLNYNNL